MVSTTSPSRSHPSSGSAWSRRLRGGRVDVHVVNGDSAYFSGPDGERLELLCYPLNDMYGTVVA